jgi:hypothetical protein|tara:strand:+ start:334 stop:636 length:303 start_codon:yes stop_codon:yes gene_type:complete
MTDITEDAHTAYKRFLEEKNRKLTYEKNNENEKMFYRHLYFFNWSLFLLSVFFGYKTYKLYKSGPPLFDSFSKMFSFLSFGILGKKEQQDINQNNQQLTK